MELCHPFFCVVFGPTLQGGYICCYQGLGPTSPGWTVVALVVGLMMWEFRLEVQGDVPEWFLKMCDPENSEGLH